jgi:NADP-dependent 3-hydroxy acid dehydrogenase YdfG
MMLEGKTALITGASRGIGRAVVQEMAEAGANLILWSRSGGELTMLAEKLTAQLGTRVWTKQVDMQRHDQVQEAAREVVEILSAEGLSLDILVNNAGLARGFDPLQDGSIHDWEEMIDTNLKGLLWATRYLVPSMLTNSPAPLVVAIGSTAGIASYAKGGVYCATKAGVRMIQDGLRIDTVNTRLRVCTIQPGLVETDFSKVRFHGDQERAKKIYDQLVPLNAGDVANAVMYVVTRPEHVQIAELTIMPTCQASGTVVHRGDLE